MTTDLHYPIAPITEAIIDIRVGLPEGFDFAILKEASAQIDDAYPQEDELFEAIGHMQLKPGVGGTTSMQQNVLGLKRTNPDRNQIVQFRRNGYTFSRLRPYDRWDTFRDEARHRWETYRDLTAPVEIARLAVRYINRIDVPSEQVDLKDYFRTSPEISPDLPQIVEQFFMQLRLPQPDISAVAVLNQTIVPPAREGVTSIVLDVDLFRSRDLPQDDDGVWGYFEDLHRVKNDIFEACITDKARGLFRC